MDGNEDRLYDRMGKVEAAVVGLRTDVDGLRKDIGEVRKELSSLEVRLVDRINQSEGQLRKDIGDVRADVLKWSFAFWIGQVVAMTVIISALLR